MSNKAGQAERILVTLFKLNDDKRPTIKALADEFSVSQRTIRRDIEDLEKTGIEIEITKQGIALQNNKVFEGFRFDDVEELTMYLGLDMVEETSTFLKSKAENIKNKILHSSNESAYHIKLDPYEDIDMDSNDMNTLEEAIRAKRKVQFLLNDVSTQASPFKIINMDEFWYLLGRDSQTKKLKIYHISDMSFVKETSLLIDEEKDIDDVIEGIQTSQFEDSEPFEVVVEVLKPISHYFKRKKHLPSQKILEEHTDGSLSISFMVTHVEEVDNLVKSWLPELKVVSPKSLATSIKSDLMAYLKYLD